MPKCKNCGADYVNTDKVGPDETCPNCGCSPHYRKVHFTWWNGVGFLMMFLALGISINNYMSTGGDRTITPAQQWDAHGGSMIIAMVFLIIGAALTYRPIFYCKEKKDK